MAGDVFSGWFSLVYVQDQQWETLLFKIRIVAHLIQMGLTSSNYFCCLVSVFKRSQNCYVKHFMNISISRG